MDLSQEEWTSKQKEFSNYLILDVRTKDEYEEKHIPNSKLLDINSPSDFLNGIETMDKKKIYFICCRSGNRSYRACDVMSSLGFEKTYNLVGGILDWKGITE